MRSRIPSRLGLFGRRCRAAPGASPRRSRQHRPSRRRSTRWPPCRSSGPPRKRATSSRSSAGRTRARRSRRSPAAPMSRLRSPTAPRAGSSSSASATPSAARSTARRWPRSSRSTRRSTASSSSTRARSTPSRCRPSASASARSTRRRPRSSLPGRSTQVSPGCLQDRRQAARPHLLSSPTRPGRRRRAWSAVRARPTPPRSRLTSRGPCRRSLRGQHRHARRVSLHADLPTPASARSSGQGPRNLPQVVAAAGKIGEPLFDKSLDEAAAALADEVPAMMSDLDKVSLDLSVDPNTSGLTLDGAIQLRAAAPRGSPRRSPIGPSGRARRRRSSGVCRRTATRPSMVTPPTRRALPT